MGNIPRAQETVSVLLLKWGGSFPQSNLAGLHAPFLAFQFSLYLDKLLCHKRTFPVSAPFARMLYIHLYFPQDNRLLQNSSPEIKENQCLREKKMFSVSSIPICVWLMFKYEKTKIFK